jgi:integrase/recombinase XerD
MNKLKKTRMYAPALLAESLGVNFVDLYINRIDNPHSRRAKLTDVRCLSKFLHKLNVDIVSCELQHLGLYREHLKQMNYSISSIKRRVSTIKELFTFLHIERVKETNIAASLKSPRRSYTTGITTAIPKDQLTKLLSHFDDNSLINLRNHLIVAFLYFTAARVGSLESLLVTSIKKVEDNYSINIKEKFGVVSRIETHPYLTDILNKYLKATNIKEGHLIQSVKKGSNVLSGKGLLQRNIWDVIKKSCKNAGIDNCYSPHSARVSSISNFINASKDIRRAQLHARHKSISSTVLYHKLYDNINQNDLDNLTLTL